MADYSFVDIARGKPELDAQEQQARIATMQQGIEEKDINLGRMRREDESGLQEKEIKRRGVEADIAQTDAEFRKTIQAEQQGVMSAELHNQVLDSSLRQTANIWRAFQYGHKDVALKALNDTHLVKPGAEFEDMRLEDSDVKGADGKPIKMLTLIPKGGGKPENIPVPMLDKLEAQLGATYKVVGNNLVRISHNGVATPLFQADEYTQNTETGVPFSKRTGQERPPAAMGVRPQPAPSAAPRVPIAAMGTGLPPSGTTLLQPGSQPPAAAGVQPDSAQTTDQTNVAPPLTRKQETHVDTRVTHATAVINKYFGISEFTGLDPKNQPKYIAIVNRASQLVRNGQPPETAANTAIAEATRAEKLQGAPGSPRAGTYTGPTPWRQ